MLAMEMAKSGELEDSVKEYEAIIAADADYVAAYYHGGQALERLGHIDQARNLYRQGIVACDRIGNGKTSGRTEQYVVLPAG